MMKQQRKLLQWFGHVALLAVAVWLAAGPTVWAQGPLTTSLDAVDTSAHPTTRALVTVIDENGIPIRGLDKNAFELNEDGGGAFAPDTVEVVANQKAAVSVMIVIDLSGTMRGRPLQAAKEATGKFLEALLNESNDTDRAAFIGFTQHVTVTSNTIADESREVAFTNDMGKLLNVINFVDVDTGTGGTPLYDAVFRAIKITAQQPGRRAILLMTDGKDQGSTLTANDPVDEANRQRIPIFPVGLSAKQLDSQYLQRLALRTGGQFQLAPSPDQLTQLFQNVLAQLKEQYVLTYSSRVPKVDGQPHTLSVQVTTSRGQNSAKLTYTLGQPITPTPAAGGATPSPSQTPAPVATAIPTPGGFSMDTIITWITENMVLAIAIVAAVLLLFLIIVIAIVLMARRRGEQQPEYASGAPAQPMPEGKTFPGVAAAGGAPSGPTLMAAGGPMNIPTAAGPSAAPIAGTQIAPSMPSPPLGAAPGPFPPPPPPISPAPGQFRPSPAPAAARPSAAQPEAEKPVTPPTSGKTMVIQRGPKLKFIGMLVDKKQSSKRFDVDKPAVTIGRAPGNDLVVEHPTVSRQHATIKIEGEDFRLYDLGSANGTFVNDQRVREPVVLQDGVTVRFGDVEYVFKRVSLG